MEHSFGATPSTDLAHVAKTPMTAELIVPPGNSASDAANGISTNTLHSGGMADPNSLQSAADAGAAPVARTSPSTEPESTATTTRSAITATFRAPASRVDPVELMAACWMALERYAPPSSASSDPNDPSAGQQDPYQQQQQPYPKDKQLLEELLGFMSYRHRMGSTPDHPASSSGDEEKGEEEEEGKVTGNAGAEAEPDAEAGIKVEESGAGASEESSSGGEQSVPKLPSGSQPPLPPAQQPSPEHSGVVLPPRRCKRIHLPEETDQADEAAPPPPLQSEADVELAGDAVVSIPPPPPPFPCNAAASTEAAEAHLQAHLERVAHSLVKRRCTVPTDDPLVVLYGSASRDAVQL